MTLLPAKPDLALCSMSQHCQARDRCYRSPTVRAIAVGEAQCWMETVPRPDEPCEEWWAVDAVHDGEALYIAIEDSGKYLADGWTVEPCLGHHGVAGYAVAWR